MHSSWYGSSGRVISSSQRPLPDNVTTLTTNIHALVGLEPTISAGEPPQTYTLDRAATWNGWYILTDKYFTTEQMST